MVMLSPTEYFFVKGNRPERKLTKFFSLSLNRMIHSRKRPMLQCFHEMIMLKEKYFHKTSPPYFTHFVCGAVDYQVDSFMKNNH